jgi:predicted Zn-dependent protease with MMP-like domain
MEFLEFEGLVREAIESLPKEFREALNNVEIVIEEVPTWRQLASVGLRHPMGLFGLYQGIPRTRRGANYMFVAPDKISIFRRPIEWFYRTPDAIKRKVRSVVWHEIGHHLGMNEAELATKRRAH